MLLCTLSRGVVSSPFSGQTRAHHLSLPSLSMTHTKRPVFFSVEVIASLVVDGVTVRWLWAVVAVSGSLTGGTERGR